MTATKEEIMQNPRRVVVKWMGKMQTEVTTRDEHTFIGDEPEVYGGDNTGPMPSDLFVASVASCMVLTLQSIARKKRLTVKQLEISGNFENTEDGKRIGKINLHASADLPSDELKKLVAQSEKICYISRTIADSVEVSCTSESLAD